MREAQACSIAATVVFYAWIAGCGSEKSTLSGALGSAGVVSVVGSSGTAAAPSAGSAGPKGPLAGSGPATAAPPTNTAPTAPKNPVAAGSGAGPISNGGGSGGNPAVISAGAPATTNTGGGGHVGAAAGSHATSEDAIIRGDAPTDTTGTTGGPFKVSMYTSGFADQPGFLAATIYYPADAEPPFSYVVFCPGFVSYQTSIQDWGPFLASHGIVIMTIDTNSSSDSVTVRQTALSDALTSLQLENERSDSPLKGKLHKSRYGLMGWSMGGGASLLNSAMHPEFKSVVTVAEHLATSPGVDAPLKTLTVPALMFAGTADTAILGLNMSQPAYEAIPDSTTKMIYEVQDADHFFFNTPSALQGVVGKYALAWQKVFLEGDTRYQPLLLVKGPMASDFRTNLQ